MTNEQRFDRLEDKVDKILTILSKGASSPFQTLKDNERPLHSRRTYLHQLANQGSKWGSHAVGNTAFDSLCQNEKIGY